MNFPIKPIIAVAACAASAIVSHVITKKQIIGTDPQTGKDYKTLYEEDEEEIADMCDYVNKMENDIKDLREHIEYLNSLILDDDSDDSDDASAVDYTVFYNSNGITIETPLTEGIETESDDIDIEYQEFLSEQAAANAHKVSKPYVINESEYGQKDDFDIRTWTYFKGNHVFVDESSGIQELIEDEAVDILGFDAIHDLDVAAFEKTIYVRCPAMQCDYEVTCTKDSYVEED